MMEGITFIVLLLLTSFLPKLSSEPICDITVLSGDRRVLNEWQSKMIDSCPENYTNRDIIRKCEHFDSSGDVDPDLFIPKTNGITNLTYINKYCGYCNNDNDTNWRRNYWRSWDKFRFSEDQCRKYKSEIRASEVNDFDKWTQNFLGAGMTLETSSYLTKMRCQGKKNWPINLISNMIPCLVDNYIHGQSERMISCQYYEENGRSCDKMMFIIDGFPYKYRSKFYYHLPEMNLSGGDYIVRTENDDIFYTCKRIYQARYWGKLVCIGISIVFLTFYLIVNFNEQYFNDFSNRLLYTYSIGSIIMSVLLTYIYLKFPVLNVSFNLVKIFWAYHFLWTIIIYLCIAFYNVGLCTLSTRCKCVCYSSIVFVCGLVLPISLSIMYLNFLENNGNQCPQIPGHTALLDVPSNMSLIRKDVFDKGLTFLIPAILFARVFFTWSDTDRKDSLTVLDKMLLIMISHWLLHIFCLWYSENENLYTNKGQYININSVELLSLDNHGVLFFILFFPLKTLRLMRGTSEKPGHAQGNTPDPSSNSPAETINTPDRSSSSSLEPLIPS